MNDYIKGYEGIQNKMYEKEVLRMKQYCHSQIEKNKAEEDKRAAKRAAASSSHSMQEQNQDEQQSG
jgi:hypothetical protein